MKIYLSAMKKIVHFAFHRDETGFLHYFPIRQVQVIVTDYSVCAFLLGVYLVYEVCN